MHFAARLCLLASVGGLLVCGSAIAADTAGGKPAATSTKSHTKAKKAVRENYRFTRHDFMVAEGYMTGHHLPDCLPSQDKKTEQCIPAGQAKRYKIGEKLAPDVVGKEVDEPLFAQLEPAPAGYDFTVVDNDILLIAPSGKVVDVIPLKK